MPDRSRWSPWILSAALHAIVVVASLFIVWTVLPAPAEPEEPVVIDFENPAPAPPRESPATDPPAASQAPALPDLPPPAPVAVAETPPASRPRSDSQPDNAPPPPTPPREVSFVTAGLSSAREVVYVVDASGSAITAFPAIAERLLESISNLHPSQRFQIVLLRRTNGAPYDFLRVPPAADAPVPVDALPENVDAAARWLESIVPGGPGDLPAALAAAMTTRAGAIFLLARVSEADAPVDRAALLAELDALNPERRTTLETMQMFTPDPTGLLEALAAAHSGTHRVVTLEDLKETR